MEELTISIEKSDLSQLYELKEKELKKYYETDEYQYYLRHKYVNYFILQKKFYSNIQGLKLMLQIRDKSLELGYKEIFGYSTYHLIFRSIVEDPKISYREVIKLKKYAHKYHFKKLEKELIATQAGYLYIFNDYLNAAIIWEKTLPYFDKKNLLGISSMYNNIALCYMKLGDLKKGRVYTEKAIQIFNGIKAKRKYDSYFGHILNDNLATYYISERNYKKAEKLLIPAYDFLTSNLEFQNDLTSPVKKLLEINELTANLKSTQKIITNLEHILPNLTVENQIIVLKIIYRHYTKLENWNKVILFFTKIDELKDLLIKQKTTDINKVQSILYSDNLKSIESEFKSVKRVTDLKTKTAYLTIFGLLLFISFQVYNRRRLQSKLQIIRNQDEIIEGQENEILANEQRLQEERIAHLNLTLSLKNATEKAFLDKIKEIKRKKGLTAEEVITELQIQVNNLLQIDKKNEQFVASDEEQNTSFYRALSEKHPDLTKQELRFCAFFKMKLSAKEIALLENLSEGSVRVYKNKIKNKLGLKPFENMKGYLDGFF